MLSNEGLPLLEGPGLPRELQSASDLDSSRGPSGVPDDQNWRNNAACKDIDINKFYIGRGEKISQEVASACASCPVGKECLDYALEYEEYGYWSGTNPVQRANLRKERGIELKPIYFDSLEKELLRHSLTEPSLHVMISDKYLETSYYYPDEISFEELFYYE